VGQGLLLPGAGGEERAAVDGAEREPGRDQGIRPAEYEKWLSEFPHTQSLPPSAQVEAFKIWDQQVGAQKTK